MAALMHRRIIDFGIIKPRHFTSITELQFPYYALKQGQQEPTAMHANVIQLSNLHLELYRHNWARHKLGFLSQKGI